MPKNLDKTVKYFANAVKNGTVTEEALNNAVLEILKVKIFQGIIK